MSIRFFARKSARVGKGSLIMKKLLMLMLTLIMCSGALLVACSSDEDEAPSTDNSWMEEDYGSATVMGPWNQISIFVPDSDAMQDCEPLKEALEKWTGKKVSFLNGYAFPTDHDIVVGYFADRRQKYIQRGRKDGLRSGC